MSPYRGLRWVDRAVEGWPASSVWPQPVPQEDGAGAASGGRGAGGRAGPRA